MNKKNIDPENFLLSVVIPVFNERETLEEILDRVHASPIENQEIVVVETARQTDHANCCRAR